MRSLRLLPLGTVAGLLCIASPVPAELHPTDGFELRQAVAGLPGTAQIDDRFGQALAVGDFDHDGRLDVAIGVPNDDIAPTSDGGSVIVVYGGDAGLYDADSERWTIADFAALGTTTGSGDRFGSALVAADFDDDGFDDLAIAAPFRLVVRGDGSPHDDAGAVFVLHGAAGGLSEVGQQVWWQGRNGLAGLAEIGDRLGTVLAAGDLDGDGFADLAIGVPFEDVGTVADAGGVNLLYGSASGLTTAAFPNTVLTPDSFALSNDENDRFGSALAIGDFRSDGAADLVIGIPHQDLSGSPDAGMVVVAQGFPGVGVSTSGATLLTRASIFVAGLSSPGERFGAAFAVGDFDGDGVDDLGVGSPGASALDDDGVIVAEVGVVDVLRGHAEDGVGTHYVGTQLKRTDFGIIDGLEAFGSSLAAADFDHDGLDELAIGSPGDRVSGFAGAGAVRVVDAPTEYPDGSVQELSQLDDAPGAPEAFDGFGSALVVGDFDGNGFVELAVGVPYEDQGTIGNVGTVSVFLNTGLFADGFELGSLALWD